MLDLEIKGGDQLYASLRQLPIELQATELTQALKAAAVVIAEEMSAEAPREAGIGPRKQGQGHIADSIALKVEPKPLGSAAEVYVGPSKSVAWRARFLEYGTTIHAIMAKRRKVLASPDAIFGSNVQHPGIKPVPFMRRALDTAGPDAIEAFRQRLAEGIARVAKKLNKTKAVK
jgi:HK97 gp10 family phage protein